MTIAHRELLKLENKAQPTWDDFARIADLTTIIEYYEKDMCLDVNDMTEAVETLRDYYGDSRTLEILERILSEFKRDIDCVSPHITSCLIEKIKHKGE